MYALLLPLHSIFRWLVLGGLLAAIASGVQGWASGRPYRAWDDRIRHVTATLVHLQFTVGFLLYFKSPMMVYFRTYYAAAKSDPALVFFGIAHIGLMTAAVVLVSIGSSLAKRTTEDRARFRTVAIFYLIGLVIMLAAIPWSFSPFAPRPLIRSF
jgi:hypothetical protein